MKKIFLGILIIVIAIFIFDKFYLFTNNFYPKIEIKNTVLITGLKISGTELTVLSKKENYDKITITLSFSGSNATMNVYGHKNGIAASITNKFMPDTVYKIENFKYYDLVAECISYNYTPIVTCHFKPVKKYLFLKGTYLHNDILDDNGKTINSANPVPPGPPGKL